MIVIGEKINATRKKIKQAIENHDAVYLADVIKKQAEAGADYIDLNAGIGSGSASQEISDMKWLIDLTLETTEKKICIDSADSQVLVSAAYHINGRRSWMLNSVKADMQSMQILLPLIAEHGAPFIALAMGEQGIARDVRGRIEACEKIFHEVTQRAIEPSLVFFDPLVMPLSTDGSQGKVACACIREIKNRFRETKTIVGLTNISHGLPGRAAINQAFLIAAMMSGLDAAIIDPTLAEMKNAVLLGNALAGHDRHCLRYARASRRMAGMKERRL